MLIVADENMPLLDEFFAGLGEIRRLPGRQMQAADVAAADLLLVRSVTRVNAALLGGARPKFVGSATIGTDHVDLDFLAAQGVPFAAAPGCNARAVAEYVATVLALDAERHGPALAERRIGVVGCGHVGRAVTQLLQALGCAVALCDPLLPASAFPPGVPVRTLEELLAWSDTLTLHVPLTRAVPHATQHLLDAARLAQGRWSLLINTARGPVVDNRALLALLEREPRRRAVLDVWEAEPAVPPALLARVGLGTPHVAGYSLEGKWRGTAMLYDAVCRALDLAPRVTLDTIRAARGDRVQDLAWAGSTAATLAAACDVAGDDRRLRAATVDDAAATAAAFDRLRRDYPERREFSHWRVTGLPSSAETKTPRGLLAASGFVLAD